MSVGAGQRWGLWAGVLALLFTTSPSYAASPVAVEATQNARWQERRVILEVDPSLQLTSPVAFEAARSAARAWQKASPDMPKVELVSRRVGQVGYVPAGPNSNTIRFAAEGDPAADGALAITIITFDGPSGRILDADIILNGDYAFASVEEAPESGAPVYDIQNVLTHEMGHFFGLRENYVDSGATMYAFSQPGEITKRDLNSADLTRFDELYRVGGDVDFLAFCRALSPLVSVQHPGCWLSLLAIALLLLYGVGARRAGAALACGVLLVGSALAVRSELAEATWLGADWRSADWHGTALYDTESSDRVHPVVVMWALYPAETHGAHVGATDGHYAELTSSGSAAFPRQIRIENGN